MRPHDPPPARYAFGYRVSPRSGNEINGLGVPEHARARHVFHSATGDALGWKALDDFFSYINPWRVALHMLANTWQLRRRDGPVASTRVDVQDPVAMAHEIKSEALRLGAALVGIAAVADGDLFEGHAVPFTHAVCLGVPMDREEMQFAPQARAAVEVMRSYRAVSRVAVALAAGIRARGWPARAYGNPNSTDILHIPLAIKAGLGQLGKHGSLISREHGSNFRLAAVLTDLPVRPDAPVDIGVDDVCRVCRRCVLDCPPAAIFDQPQLVRGVRKWYVDFDKCVPYFVKTYGCSICIEVCPWSEPGQGAWLEQRVRAQRARREGDRDGQAAGPRHTD